MAVEDERVTHGIPPWMVSGLAQPISTGSGVLSLLSNQTCPGPGLSGQTGGVKEDGELTIPISGQWDDLTFGEAFCLQGLAAPAIAGEPAYLEFPGRGFEAETGPVSELAQLDIGIGIPGKGRLGCLRQEVLECRRQSHGAMVRRTRLAGKSRELRKRNASGCIKRAEGSPKLLDSRAISS